MSGFYSKPFRSINEIYKCQRFSENDQWADTSFSKENREKLRNIFGAKWDKRNEKVLRQIFKERSKLENENENEEDADTFVVVEKLDGTNVRFCFDMKTNTGHFRSRRKDLKTPKDMKYFFNSEERLNFHKPYLKKVIDKAIENKLIPEAAEMVYLTCEMVGGKTGAKNRNYWHSDDSPLMLIPVDLSFELKKKEGSKCVPYTTNWWNANIEGFELAQKAPEPLLITRNLEEALLAIVHYKDTPSKLCSLMKPSESGNTIKEGCVLRVLKKNNANEMYKYVYSGGINVNKYDKEITAIVRNIITHVGQEIDVEEVAKQAVDEFVEDLRKNPILETIARQATMKEQKMNGNV